MIIKNILNKDEKSLIIKRIQGLNLEKSLKLWGKMSVNEMVCHCTDQIRMAVGILKTDFIGNKTQASIVKQIVLLGMPIPKAKIETTKELSQELEGTKPAEFDLDKSKLIKFVQEFDESYDKSKRIVHPAFGPLTKNQWGRLIWLHLDHHLKQFGA